MIFSLISRETFVNVLCLSASHISVKEMINSLCFTLFIFQWIRVFCFFLS